MATQVDKFYRWHLFGNFYHCDEWRVGIALFLRDEAFLKHTSELMNVATSNFPSHRVQSAFSTSPLTFPETPAN